MRPKYIDAAVGWVQVRRVNQECIVQAKMCPEQSVNNTLYLVDEEEEKVCAVKCFGCPASKGSFSIDT